MLWRWLQSRSTGASFFLTNGETVGLVAQRTGFGQTHITPIDLGALLQDRRFAQRGLDLKALRRKRGQRDTLERGLVVLLRSRRAGEDHRRQRAGRKRRSPCSRHNLRPFRLGAAFGCPLPRTI